MRPPLFLHCPRIVAALGVLLATALPSPVCRGQSPIAFRDVTEQTGITFHHTDGSGGRQYIVEYVSSGLALFDYDGDGLVDIYFLNGAPLRGTHLDYVPRNALYRNEGNWHFRDVTAEAGVGDTGHGLGVAAADYDNDGDLDLYVNNFGPNVLYRNNGDGTFTDVTREAGVANGNRVGAGVCFLDADRDAVLDLFVSNYVVFSYDKHIARTNRGVSVYPSPQDYQPDPDTFYHGNGDGTFTDATEASGIGLRAGTGMGTVCGDYDADGDTDIFVCNDVRANFLLQNDGRGHFHDVALLAGVACDFSGIPQGSMGVDCGDYDNDGWLDFFMTNYQGEIPVLYRNSGRGFFEDMTLRSGAGTPAIPYVTWGTGLVDFDNDGYRDIFIACGHLMDNIHQRDDTQQYAVPNLLMRNRGDGHFVNLSKSTPGLEAARVSRGAGFDDLDNDGDVDVVVLNSRSMPTILRNETRNQNHWVQIRLRGTTTNRDGIGAGVKVVAGDLTSVDEVHSGRGYQGHHGMRLHFGLGRRTQIDRVEVRWIGGKVEVFRDVPVDRLVTLTQGRGTVKQDAPR